ncbi:MAG: hypothetical protein JO329_07820, partial [Planctomycetaceae bacterium]|nr:hypothetical protein [Planctomycetaceae bacterium]
MRLDSHGFSPAILSKIVRAAIRSTSFECAAESLADEAEVDISGRQVTRIAHEIGDLVLTPRGVVNTGALARLFRARVHPTAIDGHDRQPGDDRYLGPRLVVPQLLDLSIALVPQFRAD